VISMADDRAKSKKEIMERMIREAGKEGGKVPSSKSKPPSVLIPPKPPQKMPAAPSPRKALPAPPPAPAAPKLPLASKFQTAPVVPEPPMKAKAGGFGFKLPSLPSFSKPKAGKKEEKKGEKKPLEGLGLAPPSMFSGRGLPVPVPPRPSLPSPMVAPVLATKKPMVPQPRQRMEGPVRGIAKRISAGLPNLRRRLREAGLPDDPVGFVQKALVGTIVMAFLLGLLLFFLFDMFDVSKTLLLLLLPLLFGAAFFYQLQYPTAKAKKRARLVDRELVFAGRQMLIELKAGVPLFDAMLSISRDYGEVSREFAKIAERVNAGVPTDLAMHDIAEDNPSMAFKRVLLQLVNSIRSGSDVAKALEAVLDQISREQITEMKAYGQKLNPLGMFYMIFGIIMPSLGIALAIIIFSFMSVSVTTTMLYSVLLVMIIMQYVFLTIIESQKPDYEL